MNQLELNKARAEVMLGAKYDENGKCINVEGFMLNPRQDEDWSKVNPNWDWLTCNYRLIPEPAGIKYKPYSKVDESWLGKKVTNGNQIIMINGIHSAKNTVLIECQWVNLEDMFKYFTWADGTPFGEVDNG